MDFHERAIRMELERLRERLEIYSKQK